ncbi:hypothetical protein, partial [Streptomyces sp. NPDC005423]|uniref:hypothetical protein n=1 Tax=Streptomyces sp. NPDC005423 TaxID=3155343 RepID=UPI0033B01523
MVVIYALVREPTMYQASGCDHARRRYYSRGFDRKWRGVNPPPLTALGNVLAEGLRPRDHLRSRPLTGLGVCRSDGLSRSASGSGDLRLMQA